MSKIKSLPTKYVMVFDRDATQAYANMAKVRYEVAVKFILRMFPVASRSFITIASASDAHANLPPAIRNVLKVSPRRTCFF